MVDPLERRQTQPITRSFTIFSVLLLLGVVILVAVMVMLIRLNTLVDDNHASNRYLLECTTPGPNPPPNTGHRCFDDGQARLSGAITQIVDAVRGTTTTSPKGTR